MGKMVLACPATEQQRATSGDTVLGQTEVNGRLNVGQLLTLACLPKKVRQK